MAGGRRTYFEQSCPRCGKPSTEGGRRALNTVNPDPKLNRKSKCVICKQLLNRQEIE